jgi:fatty-acid desaturase
LYYSGVMISFDLYIIFELFLKLLIAQHYFCLIYTLGHKLGTTKFEMENMFYIALFSC